MFFARYAKKVTMLVRSSLSKSMSQYLIEQINATPNIEVLLRSEVVEVHGTRRLEGVSYRNLDTNEVTRSSTPALFIFIGAEPHSGPVRSVAALSEDGFILTGPDLSRNGKPGGGWQLKRDPFLLETSVPGVFAAGDVRYGAMRRVASAVGQGSTAVSFVHEYLKTV
jgi:thioredoxin reductase (NADPH)